jgi:hypothetical protein
MADIMSQLYFTAKSIVAHWNANSMSATILNNTDTMGDGSVTDGRPIMTGIIVTAIITECLAVIAHYEATSSAVLNQVKGAAVNGGAKF